MKVGDLVHVSFDNGYHGIGLIIEMENLEGVKSTYRAIGNDGRTYCHLRPTYRVLGNDGRMSYHFKYELSVVEGSDEEA